MELAVATDFNGSTGCPRASLKAIAEAGFTHLHWCHQWCTDFLYGKYELEQIRAWLKEFGLTLLDIHGSQGREKCWSATDFEYRRKAGVELVLNRARMLRELDGEGVLMMHMPMIRTTMDEKDRPDVLRQFEALCRSIDELAPELERLRVAVAVENVPYCTFELLDRLLAMYPPHLIGITYDSGHGNIQNSGGLDFMEQRKNRLMALHLHDNDSSGDQHLPPFRGNIDWDRLTGIIASSSYTGPASFELSIHNTPFADPDCEGPQDEAHVKPFLADSLERCSRVGRMIEEKRGKTSAEKSDLLEKTL